jgi:hypothetical protein
VAITYPLSFRLGANAPGGGLDYCHNAGQFPQTPLAPNRQFGVYGVVVNAAYTLSDADHVVFVDAAAGAVVIDLPAFSGSPYRQRFHYRIVKIDSTANAVTVQRRTATSDTVNGGTSVATTTQYHGFDVYCPMDTSSTSDGSGNGLWLAIGCG